jgi:hypothetical protein
VPWFRIVYQHTNGARTEMQALMETDDPDQLLRDYKRGLAGGPTFEEDQQLDAGIVVPKPNDEDVERRYQEMRVRMEWDGDLVAEEHTPPDVMGWYRDRSEGALS